MRAGVLQFGRALAIGARFVPGANVFIVFGDFSEEAVFQGVAEQVGDDADGARRIQHMNHGRIVAGRDLDRRVDLGRGRAPDQQRDIEPAALHFGGDGGHFLERGRDQARQADDVGVLALGGVDDVGVGHHDAEIDDVIVITLQHHADDVLADVMHVALDRGGDDLALGPGLGRVFPRFDEGQQVGHGLFHDTGGFDHLGKEHLPRSEQVADHVHAVHQGAFDDVDGLGRLGAGFLGVFYDVIGNPPDQRMGQPFAHRAVAPFQVIGAFANLSAGLIGDFQQAFGGVLAAVEDNVLDAVAQIFGQFPVHRQLSGIDNGHVEAVFDGMVQKHRMHGVAHGVIAPERERHVGQPARGQRVGQGLFDFADGVDEIA